MSPRRATPGAEPGLLPFPFDQRIVTCPQSCPVAETTSTLSKPRAPQPSLARIIRDDAEALKVAAALAADLARGAAERDRERILPAEELELLSDAGLLAITVPKAYGGAEVGAGTVARVIALLSGADGSIGQIPQNHFFMLEALRLQGNGGAEALLLRPGARRRAVLQRLVRERHQDRA